MSVSELKSAIGYSGGIKSGSGSPLASLYQNKAGFYLRYPSDLDKNEQPYIAFSAFKYIRNAARDQPKRSGEVTVYLPMPANLQVASNMQYDNVQLGQFGNILAESGAASGAINQLMNATDTSGLRDAIKEADISQLAEIGAPTLVRNIVQKLGDISGIRVLEGAQINIGKAINPHLAALFQGVGFRTHQFQYKLIAHNQQESDEIKYMIRAFEYAMHPDIEGIRGGVFTFPYEFKISFAKAYKEYLFDFNTCVLTSMSVNYNGSNIPTFFEQTKAPVDIDINLQFQEVEIQTRTSLKGQYNRSYNTNPPSVA